MNPPVNPMLKRNARRLLGKLAVALGALTSSASLAVTVPYAENFDSYPTGSMPANFITQTTGGGVFYYSDWTVQNPSGTAGVYNDNAGGDSVSTASALEVTNIAQKDFVLSTTFVANSYGSFSTLFTDIHVGLNALASNSNLLFSGYQLFYELLDSDNNTTTTGALAIYKNGSGGAAMPFVTLPVVTGVTYTMTLKGTYSSTGLLLEGTLSNGSDCISVTYNDAAPQQGDYFGYYTFASGMYNQGAYVNLGYDNFSLTAGAGATLLSAASLLPQGTAGTFAVDMPLSGAAGVEDRSATTYNAVFTFDRPVTSGEVTLASGIATIGAISFSGNTMTAQLTGVTPAEIVTLHLQNINGEGGADADVPFGFLIGDADADRIVAKPDLALLKAQRDHPVTSANFREDFNADGRIDRADLMAIKSNKGNALP